MNSALRPWSQIVSLASVALLFWVPSGASADQPSYAQSASTVETIAGTIYQVTGRYALTLQDDRGFIDNVTFHNGTIITPTGLSLASGQVATLTGHTSGKTFEADDIDVDPSSISSGQSVLPGGDYSTTYSYGAGYPAYAFGYDPSYTAGTLYFGQSYYGGGGYYAPTGYYPGYGQGGSYVPPTAGNPTTGGSTEPIPRRPVRVPVNGNPPPGYLYPTGGNRIAPPGYRSAPVLRANPPPFVPHSMPAAPRSVSAPRSAPAQSVTRSR